MKTITSSAIEKAAALLTQGEVVAIPTETVYGLAANIYNENAVKHIFELKKRPFFNPLIVHIASYKHINQVAANIPEKAQQLATTFWPGPLTLVLPKHKDIPHIITANKSTVAVRVPNHPLTLQLLQRLDFPLAAPSANTFNAISPTTAAHVKRYFNSKIPYVLDGGSCNKGLESTIISFENPTPTILRLGALPIEDIENCIGKVHLANQATTAPSAPGMLKRHYAPQTKTILVHTITPALLNTYKHLKVAVITLVNETHDCHINIALSPNGELEQAAQKLYDTLHYLDRQKIDLIIVKKFPDTRLGKTINDRLFRATQ